MNCNRKQQNCKVAEIQGPYGPLQVLENQIQEIWAWQHLCAGNWRTTSGKKLKVRDSGIWNRGSGPDFKEAIIELDGNRRIGDIEIHLYREDWWRHGHNRDKAYNEVILHVVMFAGGMEHRIENAKGEAVEEWNMGPFVREDIESVSGGSPGLFGEHAPELREWLESDDPESIRQRLMTGADRRWQAKVSMAACLIQTCAVDGALHRMVLYYLGFPFNRRPFHEMAETFPPGAWSSTELIATLKSNWKDRVRWNYGRPANRAENRLKQYIRLQRHAPDWMHRLLKPPGYLLSRLAVTADCNWQNFGTPELRRNAGLNDWRDWLEKTVLGGQFTRGLAQRLWVDVFLPFMVAGENLPGQQAATVWFHCPPADYPVAYRDLLRLAKIQRHRELPLSNGWIQGMLWLEDQLRLERVRSALGS